MELNRITRPGGTVIVTIWPTTPVSDLNQLWSAVIDESGVMGPAGQRLPPEDDFPRSVEGLQRLLSDAGLRDSDSREVSWTFAISRNDLWAAVKAGIASVGATYRYQDPVHRPAMRAAYLRLTDQAPAGLLRFGATALMAIAHAG